MYLHKFARSKYLIFGHRETNVDMFNLMKTYEIVNNYEYLIITKVKL